MVPYIKAKNSIKNGKDSVDLDALLKTVLLSNHAFGDLVPILVTADIRFCVRDMSLTGHAEFDRFLRNARNQCGDEILNY